WNFGDGGSAVGPTATHSYGAPGSYMVTLTVTDDDRAAAVSTIGASVSDVVPPNIAIASVLVVVTPTVSDDVAVQSVTWSVDGVPQSPVTTAPYALSLDFTALAPGAHTISGVATDRSGNVSSAS